jgi:hypothetical protein
MGCLSFRFFSFINRKANECAGINRIIWNWVTHVGDWNFPILKSHICIKKQTAPIHDAAVDIPNEVTILKGITYTQTAPAAPKSGAITKL